MVWLGKYTTRYGDYFYLAFRVIIGLMFIQHGAQKLFGSFEGPGIQGFAEFLGIPIALAYIPAIIEFFGGLFIVIGLLTRWAALISAIEIVIAYIIAHVPQGVIPIVNGGELAVLFFASFLIILVYGARKWGLDKVLFRDAW